MTKKLVYFMYFYLPIHFLINNFFVFLNTKLIYYSYFIWIKGYVLWQGHYILEIFGLKQLVNCYLNSVIIERGGRAFIYASKLIIRYIHTAYGDIPKILRSKDITLPIYAT